jgi:peptide/nickel transport system substrate-binding protein
MTVNNDLRKLADDFAAKKISRRTLWKGAAALGLTSGWIAALEKGALAGPAATWSARSASAQDRATTFIVAVEGDIDTWDPGFTVGSKTSQTVLQNTFDQLTQYEVVDAATEDGTAYKTVNTGNIIGMLAETTYWDGNNLVFKLRPGLKYANGDPINAGTMVTSYQRVFEGTVSAFLIGMGDQITDSSQFSAPDDSTFVMALKSQNAITPMNNVMHNTAALDPLEIDAHKTDSDPWALDYFKKNLATANGPLRLDSYLPGDSITLVANENYWGASADAAAAPPASSPVPAGASAAGPATPSNFATVILKIVPDPTQRAQLLMNGDVDFATLIPTNNIADMRSNADVKVLSLPRNDVVMLEMNGKIAPFDNKLVRQAFAYAAPYDLIVQQVYKGEAQVAKSLVPTGMPTFDGTLSKYATDYDQAKALLEQAGFPNGEGLPDITLTYRTGDAAVEQIAILTQASLKQIGVDITISPMAYAAYNEAEQGKQLQFWIDEWLSWVNDPYYHMFWLALSTSSNNYPSLTNARVDEIITSYIMAEPGAERDAASVEAQGLILDECNYIFLAQPNWTVVTRADVDGYIYYNDELPRFYAFKRATA